MGAPGSGTESLRGVAMKLSIIIPAHNEEEAVRGTVEHLYATLSAEGIPFEILIINDHSTDGTEREIAQLARQLPGVRWVNNRRPGGFGRAIQTGLTRFEGDAVCIVMADASDDPGDVVTYYRKLEDGYECVFGSRFTRQSRVVDYPRHKLVLNRLANWFIKVLFRFDFNDTTNAFKAYRREVIAGVRPLLSPHFNITVELPLKAIVRGYTYATVPINWYNRASGVSKLKIKEMGSRYLFIVLYVWLEKQFSQGDYRRKAPAVPVMERRLAQREVRVERPVPARPRRGSGDMLHPTGT
jgi:dolichol-phosphate mannosyltransferase